MTTEANQTQIEALVAKIVDNNEWAMPTAEELRHLTLNFKEAAAFAKIKSSLASNKSTIEHSGVTIKTEGGHPATQLNEHDFALRRVQKDWAAITYLSEEMRNDRVIVRAAMYGYYGALKYASDDVKNDRDFIMAAGAGKRAGV